MFTQLEGLNWLHQGYQVQRNLILADEMGLGKTVQVRQAWCLRALHCFAVL